MLHDAIMLGLFTGLTLWLVPWLVDRRLTGHFQGVYDQLSDEFAALMAGHSQALRSGFTDVHEVLDKHSSRLEAAIEAAEAASKHARQLTEIAGSAEVCNFCGLVVARFQKLPDERICCENCWNKGAAADA